MKKASIWLLAALMSGCSSVRPYELNPVATQSNDHVAEFASGDAAVNESGDKAIVSANGRFRTALKTSSNSPDDSAKAKSYLDAGVTVADLYCGRFFSALAERKADNDAARGAFNIADGVTSAALGLAEASTTAVAGASVGFAAIESLFESIDANYLVSPEIAAVEALVFDARATLREDILKTRPPSNYYEAERSLRAYAALCGFNGVKRLVSEAVANGRPELAHTSAARDRLADEALDAPKAAISELLATKGTLFSGEQLVALYSFYILGRGVEAIDTEVERLLAAVIKKTGTEKWDAALRRKELEAKAHLRRIDSVADLKSPAEAWRKKLIDAAAAAPKPGESLTGEKDLRPIDPLEPIAGETATVRIR